MCVSGVIISGLHVDNNTLSLHTLTQSHYNSDTLLKLCKFLQEPADNNNRGALVTCAYF